MDKGKFLNLIRQLESSGGTNLEHKRMLAGPHKGDTAIGEYGMMPKTIDEFVNRRKNRKQFGPDEAIMKQLNPEELKDFINENDRIEQGLAGDIAERVLTRSKGDDDKAALMWNAGHNKEVSSISDEKLNKSDYVKKFRLAQLRSLLANKE